ncbi:MAG TPA: hypothetical protein VGK94_03785 [Candidatus Polarisedimenticolia bacterium]|jgi:hypothetical protein
MPSYWVAALCLVLTAGAAAAGPAPGQPWELVGESGWVKMVYVEPARIKDTRLLAQIVADLMGRFGSTNPMQVDFFDDRALTPTALPSPPRQRIHQRAKFNFNPRNGLRRFVWMEWVPVDPNQPAKVKPRETEEELPPP